MRDGRCLAMALELAPRRVRNGCILDGSARSPRAAPDVARSPSYQRLRAVSSEARGFVRRLSVTARSRDRTASEPRRRTPHRRRALAERPTSANSAFRRRLASRGNLAPTA